MGADAVEDGLVRRVTLVMAALATVAIELAVAEPETPRWLCAGWALMAYVVPGLAAAWCLGRRGRTGRLRTAEVASLLVLFVAPFLIEGGKLVLFGRCLMLEVVLIAAVRNLGVGFSALSHRPDCGRLAALLSLFLVMIAASTGEGTTVLVLVGCYAVAGTLWLMLAYWKRVAAGAGPGGDRGLPAAALAGVAGVVVCLVAAAAVGPTRATVVLAGLVPTSGGTDGNDPDARGGVNDGDNEVSASQNPQSVGFTQSEVYLDSDRPSLYDAFNDMYGEPYKPRDVKRMIAIGTQDVREQKERPAENLRAGREFALVRRKPDRAFRRPGEREARALVYVKGPTPLHLALTAYDRFDGRAWLEEPACSRACQLEQERGTSWFRLEWPGRTIYSGAVSHQVKVGTLDSSPLPLPSHLARFRVGSVNRADFFGWAQDGILRMVGRTVPAGTVLESEARVVDPRRLAAVGFGRTESRYRDFAEGYSIDPRVAALARDWVAGVPEGWGQVEAVVASLRGRCTLDRGATAPADCGDIVGHFLFDARRGPDYQFATAAAVLLRSLGYPARVVSGLHAAPGRYDPRTRHTPVTGDGVHFWAEVLVPGGAWVAVEPTPGYRLMGPELTWVERLTAALCSASAWAKARSVPLGLALLALAACVRFRREALDLLATLAWTANLRRPGRWCVMTTLRLIERRSRWASYRRPQDQTLARWYGPIAPGEDVQADLNRLVRLADWVLYAPSDLACHPLRDDNDIRMTCRRVARAWTLGRFRAVARSRQRKAAAP